jgi:hypothetical protein
LLARLLVGHPSSSVRHQTDTQQQPEGQHTSGTVLDGIGSAVQELRELPLARASTIVTAPPTWQVRAWLGRVGPFVASFLFCSGKIWRWFCLHEQCA